MSHKPPLPEAATPPWPASPPPIEHKSDSAEPEGEDKSESRVDKRIVAGVAGIAVGSAAVAAALLFAGRMSRPKTAAISPPPVPTPLPGEPNARDIKIGATD